MKIGLQNANRRSSMTIGIPHHHHKKAEPQLDSPGDKIEPE